MEASTASDGKMITKYLMEKGCRNLEECLKSDPKKDQTNLKKDQDDSRRDTVRYCYEAALGVKQMHDLGYAHRDIKLQNIVVFEMQEPVKHNVAKLVDFGLVRKYDKWSDKPYHTERV